MEALVSAQTTRKFNFLKWRVAPFTLLIIFSIEATWSSPVMQKRDPFEKILDEFEQFAHCSQSCKELVKTFRDVYANAKKQPLVYSSMQSENDKLGFQPTLTRNPQSGKMEFGLLDKRTKGAPKQRILNQEEFKKDTDEWVAKFKKIIHKLSTDQNSGAPVAGSADVMENNLPSKKLLEECFPNAAIQTSLFQEKPYCRAVVSALVNQPSNAAETVESHLEIKPSDFCPKEENFSPAKKQETDLYQELAEILRELLLRGVQDLKDTDPNQKIWDLQQLEARVKMQGGSLSSEELESFLRSHPTLPPQFIASTQAPFWNGSLMSMIQVLNKPIKVSESAIESKDIMDFLNPAARKYSKKLHLDIFSLDEDGTKDPDQYFAWAFRRVGKHLAEAKRAESLNRFGSSKFFELSESTRGEVEIHKSKALVEALPFLYALHAWNERLEVESKVAAVVFNKNKDISALRAQRPGKDFTDIGKHLKKWCVLMHQSQDVSNEVQNSNNDNEVKEKKDFVDNTVKLAENFNNRLGLGLPSGFVKSAAEFRAKSFVNSGEYQAVSKPSKEAYRLPEEIPQTKVTSSSSVNSTLSSAPSMMSMPNAIAKTDSSRNSDAPIHLEPPAQVQAPERVEPQTSQQAPAPSQSLVDLKAQLNRIKRDIKSGNPDLDRILSEIEKIAQDPMSPEVQGKLAKLLADFKNKISEANKNNQAEVSKSQASKFKDDFEKNVLKNRIKALEDTIGSLRRQNDELQSRRERENYENRANQENHQNQKNNVRDRVRDSERESVAISKQNISEHDRSSGPTLSADEFRKKTEDLITLNKASDAQKNAIERFEGESNQILNSGVNHSPEFSLSGAQLEQFEKAKRKLEMDLASASVALHPGLPLREAILMMQEKVKRLSDQTLEKARKENRDRLLQSAVDLVLSQPQMKVLGEIIGGHLFSVFYKFLTILHGDKDYVVERAVSDQVVLELPDGRSVLLSWYRVLALNHPRGSAPQEFPKIIFKGPAQGVEWTPQQLREFFREKWAGYRFSSIDPGNGQSRLVNKSDPRIPWVFIAEKKGSIASKEAASFVVTDFAAAKLDF